MKPSNPKGWHYDAQSAGPSNLLQRDEFGPFEEGALLTNILFSAGLFDGAGDFTNQVDYPVHVNTLAGCFPTASYVSANSNLPPAPIAPVLNPAASGDILSYDDFYYQSWLTANSYGSFTFPGGSRNCYGLPYTAVTYFGDDQAFHTAVQGGTFYPEVGHGDFFQTVAAPTLATTGYYFARPRVDPVPGETLFAVTNVTPPCLVIPFGEPFTLTAWARQTVGNGYAEQYFDKALKMDANGNITTNQTGVLSPYGYFLPTEPGQVALLTRANIDTGQPGVGVLNVISLTTDANRDGTVDPTFAGQDNTSAQNPFRFWVNNDCDRPGLGDEPDRDVNSPLTSDCAYVDPVFGANAIASQRDLEDYARLWICGLPALWASNGYSVSLSWNNIVSGNPAIRLFSAVETNGGTGYLTDTNIAAAQIYSTINQRSGGYGVSIGMVSNTFTFPDGYFTNNTTKYLLFEGAGIGRGELVLTVSRNGTNLASTSMFIDLMDVKDMFEQAHITGITNVLPGNPFSPSGYAEDNVLPPDPTEDTKIVLFVHGWRMGQWDYQNFSETMFKRLYWQGFHGRFLSLRWPTLSADDFWLPAEDYTTYNSSEFIAWRSGTGLSAYLTHLRQRFPNYSLNVCAHSMGNIVMARALKEQLAAGQQNVNNYVLMQAAVPASCYDTSLTNYTPFILAEQSEQTPNTYQGYPGAINAALTGNMVNFYNTNDYALATGSLNLLGINIAINWEANQENFKPDYDLAYRVDGGTNCANRFNTVSDAREIMAFCARPRSKAVGAQAGVGGVLNGGGVDLTASFGFFRGSDEHSAQFNWNIQQVNGFYHTLLNALTPSEP